MKIITLTAAPALDVEYTLEIISDGHLNRAKAERITAGGKGINVSRTIQKCISRDADACTNAMLVTVAALGGKVGKTIEAMLADEGLPVTAIVVEGETRINSTLISPGKTVEVNAPAPPLGEAGECIVRFICDTVQAGDVLVLAGSVPGDTGGAETEYQVKATGTAAKKYTNKDFYAYLCAVAKKRGAVCVIDSDGDALKAAVRGLDLDGVRYYPDVIKPNADELLSLADFEPQKVTADSHGHAGETDTADGFEPQKETPESCEYATDTDTADFEPQKVMADSHGHATDTDTDIADDSGEAVYSANTAAKAGGSGTKRASSVTEDASDIINSPDSCGISEISSVAGAIAQRGITVITTLDSRGCILSGTKDGEVKSTYIPTAPQPVVRHKGAGDTFLGAYVYYRYMKKFSENDAAAAAVNAAGQYVSGML